MTTGCTIEAHNFQRDLDKYAALNAVILGVSMQNEKSHQEFCAKESLTFKLLADTKKDVSEKYDSVMNFGVTQLSARHTFLIDPNGVVRKVWTDVDVKGHSDDVLAAISEGVLDAAGERPARVSSYCSVFSASEVLERLREGATREEIAAGEGTAMVGALVFLQKLRISPDAAFSVNDWTAFVIFITVIGGIGRLEGPIVGTIVFFALRQALADRGAVYLLMLGAVAIAVMLHAPKGIWGLVVARLDWQVFPLQRRVILARDKSEGEAT